MSRIEQLENELAREKERIRIQKQLRKNHIHRAKNLEIVKGLSKLSDTKNPYTYTSLAERDCKNVLFSEHIVKDESVKAILTENNENKKLWLAYWMGRFHGENGVFNNLWCYINQGDSLTKAIKREMAWRLGKHINDISTMSEKDAIEYLKRGDIQSKY